jgi:hypothetical protein
MTRLWGAVWIGLVCFVPAPPCAAQSLLDAAVVGGTVADASGGVLPGATVTLLDTGRGLEWTRSADEAGRFRFAPVAVGEYVLLVSLDGFVPHSRALTVRIGASLDVTVRLELRGVQEVVQVAGASRAVDLARTEAARVVTPDEIERLPLNGRNYLDLATLAPGVARMVTRNAERFAETSAVPGTGLSVQGQRNISNSVLIDGLSANDDAADLAGTFITQEVVREFQVVTAGGRAEFGRAGAGVISIVTESGGSTLQGSAYGFARDSRLDARNALAARREPMSQEQFGATAGGPAGRWFWFGNAEATRADRQAFVTIAPEIAGSINAVLDGAGYRGPRVVTGAAPTTLDTTNLFVRGDRPWSSGDRLALRYSLYDVASLNARTVGGLNDPSRGTSLDHRDQTIAASYVRAGSRWAVLDLRGAATRSRLRAPANDPSGPAVTVAGAASFGTATSSPTARDLDTIELAGSLTAARGAHVVKGGVDVLYNRVRIGFPGALQGVYAFPSLAAFAQGRYTTYQQAFGIVDQAQTNPNLAVYLQDEWRVRRDLTLTGGLRYDLQWLADPVRTDRNNVGPRLGVAWAPGRGDTTVRASAGIYYDRIPLRALSNALQRDGERYRVAVLPFGAPGAPAFPAVLPSFPASVLTAITTIDPEMQNGRTVQATVEVERRAGEWLSMSVGYLGLRGRHIIMSRNVNVPTLSAAAAAALGVPNLGRPDPRYGNIGRYESIGRSRSDALAVALRTTTVVGEHRVAYTFGRSLDDAGNFFFSSPQDSFDVRADWGPSDNDVRHRLVASGSIGLDALAEALAPWRLSYVFTAASAPPFTLLTGTDRNQDTNVNDRPVGVGRNTGRAWSSNTLDVRLSWRAPIRGRLTLEALVESFNVLNRTNLRTPNNVFGPGTAPLPSFGRATAAEDPRQIQIGVRLGF